MPQHYILGLGNYLCRDDGIGLYVVDYLLDHDLTGDFEAIGVGNDGMQVLTYFREDVGRILVVDSAVMGLKPGDYRIIEPVSVDSKKLVGNISTHEDDVLKLIELGTRLGYHVPSVRILAIEPGVMDPGPGLSPELQSSLETYVEVAIAEIAGQQSWQNRKRPRGMHSGRL